MDPITRCRFKVVIAGGSGNTSSELTATAIGAVQSSLGVAKLKKGSKTLTARSSESSVSVSRMRIEFNVGSPGWKDVITWWSDTNDFGKALNKRNVEVIIYDGEESPVQRILLEGAWPCRFGFMGGSTNADSGSMGQYLDFISESFRISATQPAQGKPPVSPEGKESSKKYEIKDNTIEINTGDISGAKDSFKMNDSMKASGLAKVSAKAVMGMGGGALSAVGAIASLAKPAPKISATATSSAVATNGNSSPESKGNAGSGSTGNDASTAPNNGNRPSSSPSSASGTAGGPIRQSQTSTSFSTEDVAPVVAAGAIAATTTAATVAGLSEDAKAATDSAPGLETPPTESLESVSNDAGQLNAGSTRAAGNHFTSDGSDSSAQQSPHSGVHSSTDSGSAMAAAAVMGAVNSITQAMSGSTKAIPTIDLSGAQKNEPVTSLRNNVTESNFQKPSKSNETSSQTESTERKSPATTEQIDQTLATRSALKAYGGNEERSSGERSETNTTDSSTRITIGKEDFTLDRNAEKTNPITVYLEETDKAFPDLIVHEKGGVTEKTERTVRDLVEKDLCAEQAGKKGKALEYRWCGKIIHLKAEKDSLVFRIRDEALRAALHDSLKALFS